MQGDFPFAPSTLETVDQAMFNWLDDKLNLFSTTNKGWKKAPVIWVSAERSHNVKRKKELRDNNGAFILPIITIERTSVSKDYIGLFGNFPSAATDAKGGSFVIARRIKQDKTAAFQRSDSKRLFGQENFKMHKKIPFVNMKEAQPPGQKVVYQTASIPQPIFVEIQYKITLRTEYQQQMNELTIPIVRYPGNIKAFYIDNEGHKYEAFMEADVSANNNISSLGEEERKYETEIGVKVIGYLVGDEKNQEKNRISIRENVAKIKIIRERTMVGDIPDHIDSDQANVGFYRE